MVKHHFREAAHPGAAVRREGLPDPGKLAEQGITTKETLDRLAARKPKEPAAEYHIDNANLRREATAQARADHRALIEKLRENFRDRSAKGRSDFRTAQRYRGRSHER